MGESLPDLIRRRRNDLNYRSLNALYNDRLAPYFTSQAFYRIMSGRTRRPRAHTIAALSQALEVPENEIRAAILVTLDEPPGAGMLNAGQRQAVVMLIDEFARANASRGDRA